MGSDIPLEFNRTALSALCARYGVSELSLLGSAARRELRDDSDIDLLVEFDEGRKVTLFTLIALQSELAALLGRAVDVVPKRGLKPLIRERRISEARVLYAA